MSTNTRASCTLSKGQVQVFVFGHALSMETKAWLARTYPAGWVVYKAFYAVEQMCDIESEASAVIQQLVAKGADWTGNTPTLISAPGLTVGALAVVAQWAGLTGEMPKALNLMKTGNSYAPSPELPIVDLQFNRNGIGRKLRALLFEADDDNHQLPTAA